MAPAESVGGVRVRVAERLVAVVAVVRQRRGRYGTPAAVRPRPRRGDAVGSHDAVVAGRPGGPEVAEEADPAEGVGAACPGRWRGRREASPPAGRPLMSIGVTNRRIRSTGRLSAPAAS